GNSARRFLLDNLPADVGEAAVLHARRTGRLARTAGEAAVEVHPRLLAGRRALEHLLDEGDAPARAVELVAEQLVGQARRGAETAMHALAQDRVGLAALRRIADEVGELGLHRSLYFPHEGAVLAGGGGFRCRPCLYREVRDAQDLGQGARVRGARRRAARAN